MLSKELYQILCCQNFFRSLLCFSTSPNYFQCIDKQMLRLHSGASQDVSLLQYNAAASTAKVGFFCRLYNKVAPDFIHIVCFDCIVLHANRLDFYVEIILLYPQTFSTLKKIQYPFPASEKPVEQITIALTCVLLLN